MRNLTLFVVLLVAFFTLTAQSCGSNNAHEKGVKKQEQIINKAVKNIKVPDLNNFRARKALVDYMERMDDPSKNWYIYVLSDMGNPIGYYVGRTRPISVGTYLTPPKKEYHVHGQGANPLGPSPSLDGTYYGSGGGAGQQYFFITRTTDALVEIKGLNYFCTDRPITNIQAPKFTVSKDTTKNG